MKSASSRQPWLQVREAFGSEPIVSQYLEGGLDMYVERYICEPMNTSIKPQKTVTLVTQFGGSKIGEGEEGSTHTDFFPSVSAVVPANCATEWQFSGFSDFAVFYFQEHSSQLFCRLIEELCRGISKPIPITNPLIAATSRQITEELFHRKNSSEFVERLTLVMLEQTWRILDGDVATEIKPAYIHLGRIQTTINFIQDNLNQPLSIDELAAQVQVSPTHFRRLFKKATGMSTHQFITHMRMKKARELLISTDVPLIHIAESMGFSSQSHFTSSFKKVHAVSPARYRLMFIPAGSKSE